MPECNLERMFELADKTDWSEGLQAYMRYRILMGEIARHYEVPVDRVTAAFCALSPNNDYTNNLRSLITILLAVKEGRPFATVQVSTYRHCGARAWNYINGTDDFLTSTTGLKIRNFYHNILAPDDNRYVTIDGHMCAAWRGENLTMKEAIVKSTRAYNEIADAVKRLAFKRFILPNQYQAIVWFVRKRVLKVKYDPQLSLFASRDDVWRTLRHVDDIAPYPPQE